MNWTEIKEKYPKGWGKWLDTLADIYIAEGIIANDSDLFDFFDEQGIYISINKLWEHAEFDWGFELSWEDKRQLEEYDWFENGKSYKLRKEAEEQAFMKAFSLLEESL